MTTAGVGAGVALSVVAGVFTFGIGTAVGLATTAVVIVTTATVAVVSAAGIGSGVAREYYNTSAENFKQLSRIFLQLSEHAIALFDITKELRTVLGRINVDLKYHEARALLAEVESNGNKSYSITCSKRDLVYQKKASLAQAIQSV